MCRRSARGWTVIPGAPASTQTRTASRTSGEWPPREFLSVATLLTLTDNRAIRGRGASAEMALHHVDDLLRPRADFVLVLAFEHHAQERLGAGVADEQTPVPGDARLDAGDRSRHLGHALQVRLLAHADVEENLRKGGEIAGEAGQRAAGERERPQHVQRRAQAVAGEQILREDDVPRLLAAERQAARQHLFHHVLVA